MYIIIITALILIVSGLMYRLFMLERFLKAVSSILKDICRGNLNRRFYSRTPGKPAKQLSLDFNSFMDIYEDMIDRKQYLEISRKRMISDISHDIRTPLTSLLGYIEALQKDNTLSETEKAGYLNIVASKGQLLYTLVQEFFEMSKLESDDTIMKYERLDLSEKVRAVLASFFQDFNAVGVIPDIQTPDKPLYVLGDSICIDRILHNLITNVIRYGKEGGVIGIALREEKDRVWVDIWDCGKGIPARDIPYVFERLFTAEPSRNREMRGSGLGLAIVKKLVEKQNGEISAASIPGEKTTFSFCLPKCE